MSQLLAHIAVTVMSIVWCLGNMFISLEITGPREARPTNSCNCCMRVSRFTSFKVSWVIEQVPFYCADDEGFSGFRVELGEFVSGVWDKYRSETFFDVLKIAS